MEVNEANIAGVDVIVADVSYYIDYDIDIAQSRCYVFLQKEKNKWKIISCA